MVEEISLALFCSRLSNKTLRKNGSMSLAFGIQFYTLVFEVNAFSYKRGLM